MKFLMQEKLSDHKYKDNNGYLICTDAILARTGKQTYRKNEVFADSDDDSEIEVDRKYEEVFSPATLASFENKPVTWDHPDTDVNADNHNELAVGFVRDVREGSYNGEPVIMGTLVITDARAIEEIENGEHTDLSCGYDCDIVDEENPQQRNIRGNHVALCAQGRAGIARIVDSVKDSMTYFTIYSTNISINKLQQYIGNYAKVRGQGNLIIVETDSSKARLVENDIIDLNLDYKKGIHDSTKDISSYTYYKGFVFNKGSNLAPYFDGFTKDKVVQKIKGYELWIVYKEGGSHGDLYNLVEGNEEGFTVTIEPGKITLTKLNKYPYINPILIKTAKEIENTNNIVFDSDTEMNYITNHKEALKMYNELVNREDVDPEEAKNRVYKYFNREVKDADYKHWYIKGLVNGKAVYNIVNANSLEEAKQKFIKKYNINNVEYINGMSEDYYNEYLNKGINVLDDLIQSGSEEALRKNIKTEIEAGKDPKQAAAIAYSVQRENDSSIGSDSYKEILREIENTPVGDNFDAVLKGGRFIRWTVNYDNGYIYTVWSSKNPDRKQFEKFEDTKKYAIQLLNNMKEYLNDSIKDEAKYIVYAKGTFTYIDDKRLFQRRNGGPMYMYPADADTFTEEEAIRKEKANGKYTWVKEKVSDSLKKYEISYLKDGVTYIDIVKAKSIEDVINKRRKNNDK